MTDLVTSLVATFVGGVYGRLWLGRAGLVGGVAIGLSLGYRYHAPGSARRKRWSPGSAGAARSSAG